MVFGGKILNIAAGDGRFNNELLEMTNEVLAIDIDDKELEKLINNCPEKLKNKLTTQIVDISKKLPFEDNAFDGIFCTGTLHSFDIETLKNILKQIRRTLKVNGKIVLDFATDIKRLDKKGKQVVFNNDYNYNMEEIVQLLKNELKGFNIIIESASFEEKNLEEAAGYKSINGKFLIVRAVKQREIKIQEDETER